MSQAMQKETGQLLALLEEIRAIACSSTSPECLQIESRAVKAIAQATGNPAQRSPKPEPKPPKRKVLPRLSKAQRDLLEQATYGSRSFKSMSIDDAKSALQWLDGEKYELEAVATWGSEEGRQQEFAISQFRKKVWNLQQKIQDYFGFRVADLYRWNETQHGNEVAHRYVERV